MHNKTPEITHKRKSYFSIVFLILVPTVIISLALFALIIINFVSSKSTVEDFVISELYDIAKSSETKITNIIDITQLMSGNPILSESLNNEAEFNEALRDELISVKSAYDFIDDIYILNQEQSTVCSTNGIYSAEDFYTNNYKYNNYNLSYWKNFRSYDNNNYKVLSPTVVTTPEEAKEIMPVVIRRITNLNMKNLMVFNINLKYLIDYNINKTESPEFDVYLLNKYTKEIFSSDGILLGADSFPGDFYSNLLIGTNNTFEYELPKGNVMVTSYSSGNTLIGYSYFALIPTKNIIKKVLPNIWISLAIIFIFFIASFTTALRNSSKIYQPLYNIITGKSGKQKNHSGNILQDLSSYVSLIQEQNENLSAALPYAQEKYLINYLNTTEYYIDENARNIIKESINFPNDYFSVVIIQITPTNQMFDLYNALDYKNIQSGLYNIIKELFADRYLNFALPGDKETLYIILNLTSKKQISGVEDILKTIYNLLEADMEYINLAVGKSDVYEGLDGLKTAHTEAVEALTPHAYSSDRIILNDSQAGFDFSHKDESELFTALISYNTEKAYEVLDDVLERNDRISPRSQKQLLNNLANIVLKAMRIKDVPYKENKLDFEILNDLLNQPPEGIKRDIVTLIDYFLSSNNTKQQSGTEAEEIINYIKENFAFTNLSLEFLAGYFHMTVSSISNIIKNQLGIGYHEYLTSLRTEAAKELLSNTDKSITEIYHECGFNSQQTFYRTFKKTTGFTPAEYRNKNVE